MADEVIGCVDCREDFTFTESEATFFAAKGLTRPRRCKACRQKRKDAKVADGSVAAPASRPAPARGQVQWVSGGEVEAPSRGRVDKRDRRRDRNSDDHSF